MHGEGADAVFPGTMESWFTESNDSSQDIIARFAIHASLHPKSAGEKVLTPLITVFHRAGQ
jgi:hypothetical protein